MTTRTKRLLIAAMAMGLICCSIAGWTAIKVISWANELPDEFAKVFGTIVAQSYHEVLMNGDTQTQSQLIRDFATLVANDAAVQEWVRVEYSTDLRQLTSAPNAEVAALAAELLTLLPEPSMP